MRFRILYHIPASHGQIARCAYGPQICDHGSPALFFAQDVPHMEFTDFDKCYFTTKTFMLRNVVPYISVPHTFLQLVRDGMLATVHFFSLYSSNAFIPVWESFSSFT